MVRCALAILLALAGTVAAQASDFTGNTCHEEGANCQSEDDWKAGWCEAAVAAGVFIGTAEQCVQPGGGGGYLAASKPNQDGGSGSSGTDPRNNASTSSRGGSASRQVPDGSASGLAHGGSGSSTAHDYDPRIERIRLGTVLSTEDVEFGLETGLIVGVPLTKEQSDEWDCFSGGNC